MQPDFIIEMGSKVRDKLSGIEGVIIGRLQWIYGCNRYFVQPFGSKDGEPFKNFNVDENQIEVIETPNPVLFADPHANRKLSEESAPGGPLDIGFSRQVTR